MMKFLLPYFFLFVTACLSAQTLTRSVIGSAGHSLSNSEVTVGFTIGEPLNGLIANETSINQGFWAGSLIVEAITEEEDLDGILVYPNPVPMRPGAEVEVRFGMRFLPASVIMLVSLELKPTTRRQNWMLMAISVQGH